MVKDSILPLFAHRDAKVRGACKNLCIEIYNWENVAIKSIIDQAKQDAVKKEINKAWDSIGPGAKGKPKRKFRSEESEDEAEEEETLTPAAADSDVVPSDDENVDPYDLLP